MKYIKPISIAISWLAWLLFFTAPAVYNTGKAIISSHNSAPDGEWQLMYTLIFVVSVIMTIFTFGLKWLYHWIVRRSLGPHNRLIWTYLLLPVFGFCIWFISSPIIIYGLVFFFQSHSLFYYSAFAFLSFFILIVHAPCFVIPKQQTEQGAAANP